MRWGILPDIYALRRRRMICECGGDRLSGQTQCFVIRHPPSKQTHKTCEYPARCCIWLRIRSNASNSHITCKSCHQLIVTHKSIASQSISVWIFVNCCLVEALWSCTRVIVTVKTKVTLIHWSQSNCSQLGFSILSTQTVVISCGFVFSYVLRYAN